MHVKVSNTMEIVTFKLISLCRLRESGAHTDFTITAGEKTFRVHSWVLWPGSEYWETVIFGEFAVCRYQSD